MEATYSILYRVLLKVELCVYSIMPCCSRAQLMKQGGGIQPGVISTQGSWQPQESGIRYYRITASLLQIVKRKEPHSKT
jgi:hypothetical protein